MTNFKRFLIKNSFTALRQSFGELMRKIGTLVSENWTMERGKIYRNSTFGFLCTIRILMQWSNIENSSNDSSVQLGSFSLKLRQKLSLLIMWKILKIERDKTRMVAIYWTYQTINILMQATKMFRWTTAPRFWNSWWKARWEKSSPLKRRRLNLNIEMNQYQ